MNKCLNISTFLACRSQVQGLGLGKEAETVFMNRQHVLLVSAADSICSIVNRIDDT